MCLCPLVLLSHQDPRNFWITLFIICGVCFVLTFSITLAWYIRRDLTIKRNSTPEEYKQYRRAQAKKAIQENIDYWNGPMTRADWFLRGLFKH